MSVAGLAIALILFLIALVAVAYPFWRPAGVKVAADANLRRQRERVRRYYERVLVNIRDLDEDYLTEKLSEADFQAEREVWVNRGVRLLKVQDSLDAQHSLVDDGAVDAEEIDKAIETAVRAYRDGKAPAYHDLTGGGASG